MLVTLDHLHLTTPSRFVFPRSRFVFPRSPCGGFHKSARVNEQLSDRIGDRILLMTVVITVFDS